jgi:uncharacterized membrane protein
MTANLMFDRYVIYFFVYSILGYIGEVIYCSIGARRLVNRGFMYGPWLPIYGFGGVAVRMLGAWMDHSTSGSTPNPVVVFLLSMVICSLIEYLGSWILQRWFNVKLWDYSKHHFNINGRVCLLNSSIFGLAGVLLTYVIHPMLSGGVKSLPDALVPDFSKAIIAVMSVDATASVLRMSGFKRGLAEIKEKGRQLQDRLVLLKDTASTDALELIKRKWEEEIMVAKDRFTRSNRRLLDAFPTMTSSNLELKGQLDTLRENFRVLREKHFKK